MKATAVERATSLVLATLITAGMLGAVDALAWLEDVSPAWAAAVMSRQCG